MNSSDFSIITEFAVAVAGFSGIAIAISHQGGALSPLDQFRTLNLLTWALSAAFASTFPLVAESFGFAGPAIWQFTSVGFALILLLGLLERFLTARRIAPSDRTQLSSGVWALTVGGNSVLIVWQFINALGVFGQPSAAPILVGLLFVLAVSALIFVRLLIFRAGSRAA